MFGRKKEKEIWVIAGLGNPGLEYEDTRHNCGFIILDAYAKKKGIQINKTKFRGKMAECPEDGRKLILIKPQTYMNNSGQCIQEALKWYKAPEEKLIIVYDDIDIETGNIRIRQGGSAGTHNGMKSIINHLNSDQFIRVRIGIGKANPHMDLADYVLGHFTKDEKDKISKVTERSIEAIESIIRDGMEKSMNLYNRHI